jgi:hypothetical protein
MRLSHIRRALVLAAAVSATVVGAAGLSGAHTPVDNPRQHGEQAADIKRAAEQYRGRYQLKLGEAHDLLAEAPGAARGTDV